MCVKFKALFQNHSLDSSDYNKKHKSIFNVESMVLTY